MRGEGFGLNISPIDWQNKRMQYKIINTCLSPVNYVLEIKNKVR